MIGGMPSDALADQATEWFGEGQIELTLASGSPAENDWRDVTQFAIRLLQHFDTGNVSVEGLKVSIDGRAKDHVSYHTLDVVLGAGFPDNLIRGDGNVIPPHVSPFKLSATRNENSALSLTGNVVTKQRVKDLEAKGVDVSLLNVSSGEPDGFSEALPTLLAALQQLQSGQILISDENVDVTGRAKDFATFDEVLALDEKLKQFKVAVDGCRLRAFAKRFRRADGDE